MKKSVKVLAILAIMAGILAACNFPLSNQQSDEDTVATSVALTVAAANAQVILPTATLAQPTNTLPALPTITPQVVNTVSAYPTSTALPCNQAILVSESPLDNATYNPGATFTKTWTLKNVGTCTWNTNYKLVFVSGNAMGGSASKNLTSSIAPGQSVSLSVSLTAPSSAGTYKGVWNLQGDDGVNFANFWVQIKVPGATAASFAVTSVALTAVGGDSADCSTSHTFNYQAVVTTSAAGTVTYYFTHDGTSAGANSVTFSAAGSKTLTGSWALDVPDSTHEVKLYIDNPNHQFFGSLTLTCQ